ncbi:hypothetical protein JCM3774_005267 [Rhodotorula dairenensis]
MQAPVASRSRTAAPTRRTDAASLRDFRCFQPNGEVWCFCNTEPRIKAIRRVTRKESSPNLGREFWSCGNWVEGEACGFFLWCDLAQRMGRTFVTPPPPQPQSSYVQVTDAQRRRPSPAPFAATTLATTALPPSPASSSPTKRAHFASQQTAEEVIESFEEVDLPAVEDDEDEIFDEDVRCAGGSPSTPLSSPSKKARFDSFAGPVSPQTPSKSGRDRLADTRQSTTAASSSPSSAFAAIRADPDSPFHAIQRSLFAGDTTSTPTSAAATTHTDTTASSTSARAGGGDAFSNLAGALAPVSTLLEAAQKERDKDARLLVAAKCKEETLRRSYEKERDEKERLRKENEALKNRVK